MKRNFIRICALLLAIITVLLSVVACKKQDEKEVATTVATTAGAEGDQGIVSRVPSDLYFDGEEVNFLTAEYMKSDYFVEDDATGIIDEAVRNVRLATEEKLGVKINYILDGGSITDVLQKNIENSIMAGDGGYDIISNVAHASVAHTVQGLYMDYFLADEDNYITPTFPWYNQVFVNEISYQNKLYTLVGDYTISFTDRTPVMFYNEEALATWNVPDELYDKVLEGKWTIEYLTTLIKNVYEELDNVEGKTKGDFYGLFYNNASMCNDAQIYAAGIRITKREADGSIRLAWTDGSANDAFGAVYDLAYNTDGVFMGTVGTGTYYGETTSYYSEQAFYEKRSLFSYGMLSAAKTFALDPTLSYGILPLPKYSEEQAYSTTPQNGYAILAIPHNVGNRMKIATATMETLSELSYHQLRPVYLETAYKIRYASSENTGKLFDMIIESIGVDFASYYNAEMGKPVEAMRNRLDGANGVTIGKTLTGITSMYNLAVKKSLEKLCTNLESIG